jgi:hypothetical protein
LKDGQWSAPVDIFFAPGAYSTAAQLSAASDHKGNLYAVYTSGGSLYFTRAPIGGAGDSRRWTRPQSLANDVQTPYLLSTPEGTLYLFYWNTGNEPGVYYSRSDDAGDHWTETNLVGLAGARSPRPAMQADAVMAVLDAQNRLHVIWYDIYPAVGTSFAGGIFYSRSTDNGANWSSPLTLDQDGVWPSIAVDARGILIATWNATHEKVPCARYMRTSADQGVTWTPMRRALAPMEGCLHPLSMTEDSRRVLQFAGVARDEKSIVRLWRGEWAGADWSPPEPFSSIAVRDGEEWQQAGPDRMKVAISGGNRLHAVWYTNNLRVWYVRGDLPGPAIAPLALPTAAALAPATPRPAQSAAATRAPTREPLGSFDEPSGYGQDSQWTLLAGIVPVVGLILMLVVAQLARRGR